ncbi:putative phage integrase [Rhodococcoides trifolii]|uniref:Phage integrase n=1 Tax=Rhodococcoides trifolii TaxID=908250 RepID=A0A917CX65_9NOCA|nr:tyrosine-type recombinase/integrase [Rhodococcus trifolii]GGG01491.1 putative phage integrase [Rhodococcus trifolii]
MEPGEWGQLVVKSRNGVPYARAYIRDHDGKRRLVEAQGKSADDARRKLQARLRERVTPDHSGQLTKSSTVRDLASYWLSEKKASVTDQTFTGYTDIWTRICEPAIGELLIREVRTGTLDSFFKRQARIAPSRARSARVVCSGMFSLAVRLDLIDNNPAAETQANSRRRSGNDVRALTLGEFAAVRNAIARYCGSSARSDGKKLHGPKPSTDLEDVLTILISTGARIGEVLALRWADVRLDDEPPSLEINGTLITPRYKGESLRRQDFRKGDAPPLTLTLPAFAVEVLRRRILTPQGRGSAADAVFATTTGNWVSASNVRRAWRLALGDELAWVKPHSMRKTVATMIKAQYGVEGAQVQLGHSNSRVTEAHYIQRVNVAPDMTSALITFAPDEDVCHE